MGIARVWSTFCLRFLVCAAFRCTFAATRASNRGSYPPSSLPTISCCPPKVMPKSSALFSTGAGELGIDTSKTRPYASPSSKPPTRNTMASASAGVFAALPRPRKKSPNLGANPPLDRQARLRCQLRLELRQVTMSRSGLPAAQRPQAVGDRPDVVVVLDLEQFRGVVVVGDRKSTRLNSSHANISYAVF